MDKYRTCALIVYLTICAFVLSHPVLAPQANNVMPPEQMMADNAALFAASADSEAMMAALRLEANDALVRLQAEVPDK